MPLKVFDFFGSLFDNAQMWNRCILFLSNIAYFFKGKRVGLEVKICQSKSTDLILDLF